MEAVALIYLAPFVACGLSLLATALHTWQEVADDGGPIWEYLGITQCWPLGVWLLIAFGAAQCLLAVSGYANGSRAALAALAAIRGGDFLWSHLRPWAFGRRPNPGVETAALYAIESTLITLALWG